VTTVVCVSNTQKRHAYYIADKIKVWCRVSDNSVQEWRTLRFMLHLSTVRQHTRPTLDDSAQSALLVLCIMLNSKRVLFIVK